MSRHLRQRLLALGLLALAVVTVFHLVTGVARSRHNHALEVHLEQSGLSIRLKDQIAQLSTHGALDALPREIIWPGAERGQLEIAMQEQILAKAQELGLQLTSFGPAQAPSSVKLPAMGYQIEAAAGWDQLLSFVDAINQIEPALAIGELSVRSQAQSGGGSGPALAVRAVVWGLTPDVGASSP